jgi:hypothetical protein
LVIPGSNPGGPATEFSICQVRSEFKRLILSVYGESEVNHMSFTRGTDSTADRVVSRFTRYLNGPLGKTVLENLEEGENFILQTSEHTLRVTKRSGRAVVELLQMPLV